MGFSGLLGLADVDFSHWLNPVPGRVGFGVMLDFAAQRLLRKMGFPCLLITNLPFRKRF